VAASVLTLALTGFVILMAHPRLYWGAVGNDLTPALLELLISRNHKHGGWEKSVAFFPDTGSSRTSSTIWARTACCRTGGRGTQISDRF
jgi:hypothetical protein